MKNGTTIVKRSNIKKYVEGEEWNMYRGTLAIRTVEKWHTFKVTVEKRGGDKDVNKT